MYDSTHFEYLECYHPNFIFVVELRTTMTYDLTKQVKQAFLIAFFCFSTIELTAQQPKLMLPYWHDNHGVYTKFSPNGKFIATYSTIQVGDPSVKVWDVQTGSLLVDLKGHSRGINSVDFSSDNKYLITASVDKSVKLWDIENGLVLNTIKGNVSISSAKFSSDDKFILIAARKNILPVIWDVEKKTIKNFKGHTAGINGVYYAPNDSSFLSYGDDGYAKIWNLKDDKIKDFKHEKEVSAAKWSSNGHFMLTVSGGKVRIWDVKTEKLMRMISDDKDSIQTAEFAMNMSTIITTGSNSIKSWDINTGQNLKVFAEKKEFPRASVSPNGRDLVIEIYNSPTSIWDIATGKLRIEFKEELDNPSYSSDGKFIAGGSMQTAKIYRTDNGKLISTVQGHITNLVSLDFINNEKNLISSYWGEHTKIWDLEKGELVRSIIDNQKYTRFAKPTIDSKLLVLPTSKHDIKLWNLQENSIEAIIKGDKEPFEVEISNDMRMLAIKYSEEIKIYDVIKQRFLHTLKGTTGYENYMRFSPDDKYVLSSGGYKTPKLSYVGDGSIHSYLLGHNSYIQDATFSPDGSKVLTSSLDSTAKIWDVKSGKMIYNLTGHMGQVHAATYSNSGKLIVTASSDQTAIIWNAEKGTRIFSLKGHKGDVLGAKFSSDGEFILTNGEDGTAKIWSAKTGALISNFAGHTEKVTQALFTSDGKNIITASTNDATIKVWDRKLVKLLYNIVGIDSNDYIVTDEYGRYDGTEAARKLLYLTCGTEVISLEQVKDLLWVPGLAKRIMKGETINAPKLLDLNICDFSPQIIDNEEKDVHKFKIIPRRGGLGETVLLINGIEVKRYQPQQLTKIGNNYELTVSNQELQNYFVDEKSNQIAVKSYTATNDISSRGVSIEVKKAKPSTLVQPNLYAVFVGVSDYKGEALDLKYAAKDASDISRALGQSARKLLNTDGKQHVFIYNLHTGPGRDILPEKIAIKNVFLDIGKKATANDIVLVFFAGHGVMQGENKQFFFLTADASPISAVSAPATVGIGISELSDWLKPANVKAQKRVLIFDACNSGQAVNEFVRIGNTDQQYLTARNDEQSQQIKAIEKLNEKSGMFILSASASNQNAYEMGKFSQGLLTYSLLKVIRDQPDILEDNKYLNISRWFSAAEKTVTDIVRETGNRQQPQIVSAGNFNIGVVDKDIIAVITLPQQKIIFSASNFQNNDESIGDDDQEISKAVNTALVNLSTQGLENMISYINETNSPDAWRLSGRYEMSGDLITIKVNIRNKQGITKKLELAGKKLEKEILAEKIVKQAVAIIGKH